MANPKTQNLELELIDRTSPTTTYLNLDSNLDQNWQKIDEKLGIQVLDRYLGPVPVKAGTQIVQGGETPAIAMPTIDGRSLINILGDAGNFESLTWWTASASAPTISLDTANARYGTNAMKAVSTATGGFGFYREIPIDNTKTFLLVVDALKGTADSIQLMALTAGGASTLAQSVASTSNVYNVHYVKLTPAILGGNTTIRVYMRGVASAVGQTMYADGARLIELSSADSAKIDVDAEYTGDKLAAKYPYVGTGINPVQTPTIDVVQDNILPALRDSAWSNVGAVSITDDYRITFTASAGSQQGIYGFVPVIGGQTYALSVNREGTDGRIRISQVASLPAVVDLVPPSYYNADNFTFTPVAGCNFIMVYFTNESAAGVNTAGVKTFTNPVLMPGSVAPTFKPQRKTTFRANTELCATPDGAVKDTFKYVNGKPKRIANLRRVVLDGTLPWAWSTDLVGSKQVRLPSGVAVGGAKTGISGNVATKYDGKVLVEGQANAADQFVISAIDGAFYVCIADPDSGWSETYTPSAAEIQAYFYGYKMYQEGSDGATPYSSGNKWWKEVGRTTAGGTNILPTAPATGAWGWKPYQLQYQLSTPVIEDVAITGAAVVERGANTVTLSSTAAPIANAVLDFALSLYSALEDVARGQSRLYEIADRNDMRDLWVNSGGYIWQRGPTIIGGTTGYAQDRMRYQHIGDSTVKIYQHPDAPDGRYPGSARIEQTATGAAGALDYISQRTPPEEYLNFKGKQVTFGWYMKVDPGLSVRPFINDAGISGVGVMYGPFIPTGSWQLVTITKRINEILTMLDVGLEFTRAGITAGGGMNVIPLGANLGYELRPFQPRKPGDVLAECMRFYESLDFNAVPSLFRVATNLVACKYPFKVQKRISPTLANASDLNPLLGTGSKQVSLNRIADNAAITATGNVALGADSVTFMTKNIGSIYFSAVTSFSGAAGDAVYIQQPTKDTLIGFDAEV